MQKRRLGMFLATLFLLSSSITSTYIPSHLEAKQLTDENIVSVEFKSGRDKISEQVQEFKDVQNVKIVEMAMVEEAIEEEIVYPSYNPYNLLEPSNITNEQARYLLEGTNLEYVSRMYVYMEELYGLNALFLMALNIEESGYARSSLALNNNNLGGVKTRNGDWAYFNDFGESIQYIAELLYYEYLSEDGLFHNGYSIWDVNVKYCVGGQWSENINEIGYELLNKLY